MVLGAHVAVVSFFVVMAGTVVLDWPKRRDLAVGHDQEGSADEAVVEPALDRNRIIRPHHAVFDAVSGVDQARPVGSAITNLLPKVSATRPRMVTIVSDARVLIATGVAAAIVTLGGGGDRKCASGTARDDERGGSNRQFRLDRRGRLQ